jgi:hypothetical protein
MIFSCHDVQFSESLANRVIELRMYYTDYLADVERLPGRPDRGLSPGLARRSFNRSRTALALRGDVRPHPPLTEVCALAERGRRKYHKAPTLTRWPRPSCGRRAPGSRRRTRLAMYLPSEAPLPQCGCVATSSPGGERVTCTEATRLRTNDTEYRVEAAEKIPQPGSDVPSK